MGDRFYQAQLKAIGTCPGYNGKRKSMAWDDTKKAKATEMYLAGDPSPENSMEIVKEIADSLGESPNGVRMILTKADVYIKKTAAATKASPAKEGGGARVGKDVAHARLTAALVDRGADVNDEIISKLTGKAALYFAEVLEK